MVFMATDRVEVGDDLVEDTYTLQSFPVGCRLLVEVLEARHGSEHHTGVRVVLMVQILASNISS